MDQAPQQDTLELTELDSRRNVGRVEAAIRRAVLAGGLTRADEGAAEVAAGLGRGLDLAIGRGDPYAIAAVGKPLTEQLARLHLDPEARGAHRPADGADPWDRLLEEVRDELKGGAHGRPTGRPGA